MAALDSSTKRGEDAHHEGAAKNFEIKKTIIISTNIHMDHADVEIRCTSGVPIVLRLGPWCSIFVNETQAREIARKLLAHLSPEADAETEQITTALELGWDL